MAAFVTNCAPGHTWNLHCRLQYFTWTWRIMTLPPLWPKTWICPNPRTNLEPQRSHTRNILSPNALTNRENILNLYSVDPRGECQHMYTGIFTTNTNVACISQLPIPPINLAPTNSSSFAFELSRLYYSHYTFPPSFNDGFRNLLADYQDRMSPQCLTTGTTVPETKAHIVCHCLAIKGVLEKITPKFQGLTRLLDLPPLHLSHQTRLHEWCLSGEKPSTPSADERLRGIDYRSYSNL